MKKFGPGLLVTAAFIGPGTITTASVAGANFGFALLWALLFSVIATIVLQEMAARLGLVTRAGLAEALRSSFSRPWLRGLVIALVVSAVGFGNAAYEAGNIAGAALGAASLIDWPSWLLSLLIGAGALLLLISGQYKLLERALIVLVLLMSAVFIITMLMLKPDLGAMARGLLLPSLPEASILTVIALIGTTVVPYNLFLHASAIQEKWGKEVPLDQSIQEARWDTGLSIGIGGLITLAVMSTAAAAFFGTGTELSAATMASQLEPLLGKAAKYFFALGLLAAGLTSAITAPLAAAYAVCGAMGWPRDLDNVRFKTVWLVVLVCGVFFAAIGTKPIAAILFAQAANGFLLPLVAIFLLVVMNRRALLGDYCNHWFRNLLGGLVVLVASGLGGVKLLSVLGVIN